MVLLNVMVDVNSYFQKQYHWVVLEKIILALIGLKKNNPLREPSHSGKSCYFWVEEG